MLILTYFIRKSRSLQQEKHKPARFLSPGGRLRDFNQFVRVLLLFFSLRTL